MSTSRSWPARVFLSADERRLRTGWRLLLHTVLFFFTSTIVTVGVIQLGRQTGTPLYPSRYLLLSQIIQFFSLTLSVWVARRLFDRRTFISLGLHVNWYVLCDLLAGILIAGVMMGSIFFLHLLFGWTKTIAYAWQSMPPSAILQQLAFWLFIFLLVGWSEELWVRGYIMQNLVAGLNLPWGVFLSAAIFGLMHLGNPNATWVSALGILLAGLFLALPWVWTGNLWLSIGLHIGWNFFEGAIFGFPVSGIDTFRLLQPVIHGSDLWTGGRFGPEAGLVLLPALLLGTLLVWGYARQCRRQDDEGRM